MAKALGGKGPKGAAKSLKRGGAAARRGAARPRRVVTSGKATGRPAKGKGGKSTTQRLKEAEQKSLKRHKALVRGLYDEEKAAGAESGVGLLLDGEMAALCAEVGEPGDDLWISDDEREAGNDMTGDNEASFGAFEDDGRCTSLLADLATRDTFGGSREAAGVSQEVAEVYKGVADYLRRYRSGKLPKAFRIIPRLTNWESILLLTLPEDWTPHAMFAATKLFVCNMARHDVQSFIDKYLYPAVRRDMLINKKLAYHHYHALRKAIFKPAPWFRGIFLKMAKDGSTIREATILAGLFSKASIPPLYAAAALMKLCAMTPWTNVVGIFITAIVSKNYSLPEQSLNAVVAFFCRFGKEAGELPLVWHKGLLVLAKRYAAHLSSAQLADLMRLARRHHHHLVGPLVLAVLSDPAGAHDIDMESF